MCKEHAKTQDCALLGTVDPYGTNFFSFSSASSAYTWDTFISDDDTVEDLHPCEFTAKVQTHDLDNPTYKDILRGSVAEKIARDEEKEKKLVS